MIFVGCRSTHTSIHSFAGVFVTHMDRLYDVRLAQIEGTITETCFTWVALNTHMDVYVLQCWIPFKPVIWIGTWIPPTSNSRRYQNFNNQSICSRRCTMYKMYNTVVLYVYDVRAYSFASWRCPIPKIVLWEYIWIPIGALRICVF